MNNQNKLLIAGLLLLGAVLFVGQKSVQPSALGRYQIQSAGSGGGVYVCDTSTGTIKFISANRQTGGREAPSSFGVPFDQLP